MSETKSTQEEETLEEIESKLQDLEEEEKKTQPKEEKPPTVEKQRKRRFNLEMFRQVAEALKWIQRAIMGLDLEEDKFQGMMNVKDIRERTRIAVKGIRRHVYFRVLGQEGGRLAKGGLNPYDILIDVADQEDTYLIAKDGEQRKEYILLKRSEATQVPQNTISIGNIPNVETRPEQPKKAHFWSREKPPND
jgi:hypothetical protein